jgi:small subunit ribosomal protein S20
MGKEAALPKVKSVGKAVRSAEKRRMRSRSVRSAIKTHITKTEYLLGVEDWESARQTAVATVSRIDRAASKGIIHRNKAARLKSRLMKKLNRVLPERTGG